MLNIMTNDVKHVCRKVKTKTVINFLTLHLVIN